MTIIGPSIVIRGEITSDESIAVYGRVQGLVLVRGDMLAISTGARVDGDIRGVRVMVEGTVNGPIQVTHKVELARTARVEGNLAAAQVVVWDGAWFQGGVQMTPKATAPESTTRRARDCHADGQPRTSG